MFGIQPKGFNSGSEKNWKFEEMTVQVQKGGHSREEEQAGGGDWTTGSIPNSHRGCPFVQTTGHFAGDLSVR
jgi:hypothetical protein